MATTSAQWYQVSDNAQAQLDALLAQRLVLEERIRAWRQNGGTLLTAPDYPAFAAIGSQIAQLQQTATDARQKGFQALESERTGGESIPPPAGDEANANTSGNNTEVTTETEPTYSPLQTPPGTDEFDGIDTQVENNLNSLQEPPDIDPDEDPFEAERLAAEERLNNTPEITSEDILGSSNKGTSRALTNARTQPTRQDQEIYTKQEDWRVRLSLAPSADYLYKARPNPGILKPLADTNGVIFPYTPNIQVNYSASYDATDLVHSNYKVYQYKNSAVDSIQISCDFTAQDTYEANYLLAVIHFFRTVTKMFYGQDNNPKPGTPPPLCFLTGLGAFQFNEHPIAITSFTYSLPTDVDYIRAGQITSLAGVNQQSNIRPVNTYDVRSIRLAGKVKPGGSPSDPEFGSLTNTQATVTYVPTKMQIQIGAIPMLSRNDVSNNFSLTDYASGKLLRGIQDVRGGFW